MKIPEFYITAVLFSLIAAPEIAFQMQEDENTSYSAPRDESDSENSARTAN